MFLGPWDPRVHGVILYSLAHAAQRYGVQVHHFVAMMNHVHLIATMRRQDGEALWGKFLHEFHLDVSKALNVLMASRGYDRPKQLWDGERPSVVRLVGPGAQLEHLAYQAANPVAAGLVNHPDHMPGRTIRFEDWIAGGLVVDRPDIFFGSDRPAQLELSITPPPELLDAYGGQTPGLVRECQMFAAAVGKASKRPGKVIGVKKLRATHPWDAPRTLAETGGELKPTFKIGVLAENRRELGIAMALGTKRFRNEYREARQAWRNDREVEFPHGTYGMRVYHGANVAPPVEGCLLDNPDLLCPVDTIAGNVDPKLDPAVAAPREQAPRETSPPQVPVEVDASIGHAAVSSGGAETDDAADTDDIPTLIEPGFDVLISSDEVREAILGRLADVHVFDPERERPAKTSDASNAKTPSDSTPQRDAPARLRRNEKLPPGANPSRVIHLRDGHHIPAYRRRHGGKGSSDPPE